MHESPTDSPGTFDVSFASLDDREHGVRGYARPVTCRELTNINSSSSFPLSAHYSIYSRLTTTLITTKYSLNLCSLKYCKFENAVHFCERLCVHIERCVYLPTALFNEHFISIFTRQLPGNIEQLPPRLFVDQSIMQNAEQRELHR